MSKVRKIVRTADTLIFFVLCMYLVLLIFSTAKANVTFDDKNYYSVLDHMTKSNFSYSDYYDQRKAPGYPALSSIIYAPLVAVEKIVGAGNKTTYFDFNSNRKPAEEILFKDIFRKDILYSNYTEVIDWKILWALALTSWILLFIGVFFIRKILISVFENPITSIIPASILISPIFMFNIITTPLYPTCATFGIAALFFYCLLKSIQNERKLFDYLTGAFLGILVLIRYEAILLFVPVTFYYCKEKRFAQMLRIIIGGIPFAILLLLYNYFVFADPFQFTFFVEYGNMFVFNLEYIWACLFNSKIGVFFFSIPLLWGIIGVIEKRSTYFNIIGIGACILLFIFLIRAPVFGTIHTIETVIRDDINRYAVILYPVAIIGIQNIFELVTTVIRRIFKIKATKKDTI